MKTSMMLRHIALSLFVLIVGCEPSPASDADKEWDRKKVQVLVYLRDDRTGLCFAGRSLGTNWGLLTSVPCTHEVLKLIEASR